VQRYTYDDYKTWEDRWELIDGIAYAMAPAPYPRHQKIVFAVSKELDSSLDCIFKNICDVYISPVDWKIDEQTVVQPDVAIFCEESEKQYFSKTPILVVEVLSRATALKDTTVKYALYEKIGVASYIIIDPERERAEIFELKDEKYVAVKKIEKEGVYRFLDENCSVMVDFGRVFGKK